MPRNVNPRLAFLLGVGIVASAFLIFAAGIAGIGISANGVGLGTVEDIHVNAQSPIVLNGVSNDDAATLTFSLDPAFSAGSGNVPPGGTDGQVLTRQGASGFGWATDNHVSAGSYAAGILSLMTSGGNNVRIPGIPQPDGVVTGGSLSGGTLTLDRSGTLTDITVSGFTSGGGADGVITGLSYTSPDLTVTRSVGNDLTATLPLWLTSVTTDATITGAGTSASPLSGYDNADADARVAAGVSDWAEFGNTARIPSTKMSFGYGYVPAASGALIVVQTSPVNISIINTGFADGVFTDSIPVSTHTGQRHALVGILNSLVSSREDYAVMWGDGTHSPPLDEWTALSPGRPNDPRAQAFTYYEITLAQIPSGTARLQHLIQIEEDLIPNPAIDSTLAGTGKTGDPLRVVPSQAQVPTEAVERVIYSHVRGAPTASPEDDDRVLFRDDSAGTGPEDNPLASVTFSDLDSRWVDRDDPTYVDLSESFIGGTWTTSTQALISSDLPTSTLPASSASVESQTYVVTLTTGPLYTNYWTVVRIPAADRSNVGKWRLFQDETDDPTYYHQSDWSWIKTVGSYAYFGVQIPDRPASVNYRMQELTAPYELNRAKVDVACAVQNQQIYLSTKATATFAGGDFTRAGAVSFDCGEKARTETYAGGGSRYVGIAIASDQYLYHVVQDQATGEYSLQSGGTVPISGANFNVWVSDASSHVSNIPMVIVTGD